MNAVRKKALLILGILGLALGAALVLTIVVGDEGLGIYAGNFGVVLVTPVAAVVSGVLFVRGRIVGSVIFLGIGLFFIALLELTYVGLYLRHRSNIRHARELGEELVPRLDSFKRDYRIYPKSLAEVLVNWHSPYLWLLPDHGAPPSPGSQWTRNVSIHFSGDEMSFTLLVCPPTSPELGMGLILPAPKVSFSTLRPVAYTSAVRNWREVDMDACRFKTTAF